MLTRRMLGRQMLQAASEVGLMTGLCPRGSPWRRRLRRLLHPLPRRRQLQIEVQTREVLTRARAVARESKPSIEATPPASMMNTAAPLLASKAGSRGMVPLKSAVAATIVTAASIASRAVDKQWPRGKQGVSDCQIDLGRSGDRRQRIDLQWWARWSSSWPRLKLMDLLPALRLRHLLARGPPAEVQVPRPRRRLRNGATLEQKAEHTEVPRPRRRLWNVASLEQKAEHKAAARMGDGGLRVALYLTLVALVGRLADALMAAARVNPKTKAHQRLCPQHRLPCDGAKALVCCPHHLVLCYRHLHRAQR